MALSSSSQMHLFLFSIIFSSLLFLSSNASSNKPNAYSLQVQKDKTKLQYYTSLKLGTSTKYSQFHVSTVIDLGGDLAWLDCVGSGFNSSSYRPVHCGSDKCKAAKGSGCSNKYNSTASSCGVYPYNPIANAVVAAGLAEDRLSAVGQASVNSFPLSCVSSPFLKGMSNRTKGVLGLSRARTALPAQLSLSLNLSREFALCLPSSTGAGSGSLVVGGGPGPYPLTRTPLLVNNVSTAPVSPEGEPSDEYFIGVTGIRIDGRGVASYNSSLLEISRETGVGGTKMSTVEPYTVLQTPIYKAVVKAFVKAAAQRRMKRVRSVKPFGACFSVRSVGTSKKGPVVPRIDLVIQSVDWRIYGANSMVKVRNNVTCLGFVDGGKVRRTSILIGGLQMEDNLLHFDLINNTFGFSSTLLANNATCTHYGFTAR